MGGQGGFDWKSDGSSVPPDHWRPSFFSLYGGVGRTRPSPRLHTSEPSATHTHTHTHTHTICAAAGDETIHTTNHQKDYVPSELLNIWTGSGQLRTYYDNVPLF